jgi:hypothetical protein
MKSLRIDRDDLINEAKERFKRSRTYYSKAYEQWDKDWKFGHGDSYNNYQWPDNIAQSRQLDNAVTLTINKTRQHCLQIVNALSSADAGVSFTPISDEASKEAAETFEGVARYIQYTSNARSVFRNALTHQVYGGIGFWRLVTDYRDHKSREQDIFFRNVPNPTRVFFDPACTEPDWSDAKFAFVFDEMRKDDFERQYPDAEPEQSDPFGETWRGSRAEGMVGIVEYFRRETKKDRLFYLETGETVLASLLPVEIRQRLREDDTDSRLVETTEVQWFKLCGNQILEKTIWPGEYIPIVPVFAETTIIDGEFDCVGHVRAMLDAQRQYNYMRSAATQAIGLQTKVPFVGPIEAFSGVETYWENANRANYAYIPYNGTDSNGQPIAPPQRAPSPIMPQAYIEGTQAAAMDMQMVSGQFEAAMGEASNERSGVAIQQRQMAGEQGADHFKQGFEQALRLTGKILLNLIPKVMTAKRVLTIMGQDGKESRVVIDPNAPQSHQTQENEKTNQAQQIFNPNVGKYSVEAEVGPSFLTRRQQAFEALMDVIKQAPEWAGVVGDLLMKNAPFPTADEMAERLRRMVPPQALGGPSPQEVDLQQQNAKLHQILQEMVTDAAEARIRSQSVQQQKRIDAYKAETDRMESLKDIDPAALRPLILQLVHEALHDTMTQSAPLVTALPDGTPNLQMATAPAN